MWKHIHIFRFLHLTGAICGNFNDLHFNLRREGTESPVRDKKKKKLFAAELESE